MCAFWKKTIAVMGFALLLLLLCGPALADKPPKTILAFGDSLTAGYGLRRDESFPAQLQARLQKEGLNVRVVNGGASGDTTAGGLRRLEYALKKSSPDCVILALGGNDMLRGIDPAHTQQNLKGMLDILRARRIPVLLAGMRAYPGSGPGMDAAYVSLYKSLAEGYGAVFYPFFLKGVALDPALNLDDGIHPTARGVAVIVENILPSVAALLVRKKGA